VSRNCSGDAAGRRERRLRALVGQLAAEIHSGAQASSAVARDWVVRAARLHLCVLDAEAWLTQPDTDYCLRESLAALRVALRREAS
jgi:hypothetical protein